MDTTANMIALGTFALLEHPGQWAAPCADPALTESPVEELMHYLTVVPSIGRAAIEDVELDGHLIKSGSTVLLATAAVHRVQQRV